MNQHPTKVLDFFFLNSICVVGSSTIIFPTSIRKDFAMTVSSQNPTEFIHNIFAVGLMWFFSSLIGVVLTAIAIKGIDCSSKYCLLPLMMFLKVIPMMMSVLSLCFLVDWSSNTPNCVLFFTSFLLSLLYFIFSLVDVLPELSYYLNIPESNGPDNLTLTGISVAANDSDDVLPTYDELIKKEKSQEDDFLPTYESACEKPIETS